MAVYESLLGVDQNLGKTEELEEDIEVESNQGFITHDGTVDYRGRPASRTHTGGWKIVPYICAMEVTEKLATTGSQSNLVSYLTEEKKLQLPYAANIVTNFMGTSFLLSLLGGVLADSFLGRFHSLIAAAITEMLGFFIMVLTVVVPFLNNQDEECPDPLNCKAVHGWGLAAIYVGLYVIALGIGGIKATVSPFGADQFEAGDPAEASLLPSYFNWFYWATTVGSILSGSVLVYIQDRVGWDWGYGILLVLMALALCQLLVKRRNYRYRVCKGSPLITIVRVFVSALRNHHLPPLTGTEVSEYYDEMQSRGEERIPLHTNTIRWLDKAAKYGRLSPEKVSRWRSCEINEVEDVKMLLRLLPIWLFTIFYWTTLAQATTFAVAQIGTTQRHLGPNFQVPPGTLAPVAFNLTIVLFLPLYDRFLISLLRKLTGQPKGLTTLQRIGVGMAIPVLSMVVAALVEARRLGVVHDRHLEGSPKTTLPFSMWWFVPQYVILAIGEAFVYPGQLEFFYSEAPDSMQSLGTALMFCTISFGYFTSSVIVSAVNDATGNSGGWLTKNVNTSRLDNYYWLLSVMAAVNFCFYLLAAKAHQYKNVNATNVIWPIKNPVNGSGNPQTSNRFLSSPAVDTRHQKHGETTATVPAPPGLLEAQALVVKKASTD
ncbi:hypothetical protein R1flu_028934 [Riccia fluitans]|uniref:NPF family transporter n=1 Tax=Riccia fluitans TaxID=41844 RepID=A0ABD1XR31_9MARC